MISMANLALFFLKMLSDCTKTGLFVLFELFALRKLRFKM